MYQDVAQNLELFTIQYPKTFVPNPSDSDYENGYIIRFFTRKINEDYGHIFEIDETTYSDYFENPFWKTVEIRWRISGQLEPVLNPDGSVKDKGVIAGNKASISTVYNDMKNLALYLPNLKQFYRG